MTSLSIILPKNIPSYISKAFFFVLIISKVGFSVIGINMKLPIFIAHPVYLLANFIIYFPIMALSIFRR